MTSLKQSKINSPRIMAELVDDEMILIDFDSGSYYSLRGVGCFIVEMMREWTTEDQIVQAVFGRYEGESQEVRRSVTGFLAELEREKIITSSTELNTTARRRSAPPELPAGNARIVFEPPVFEKFDDMQELLLLDPIHEVDDAGWPSTRKPLDD